MYAPYLENYFRSHDLMPRKHGATVYNNTNYQNPDLTSPAGWNWKFGTQNESEFTYVQVRRSLIPIHFGIVLTETTAFVLTTAVVEQSGGFL
jgi:hypothetical protein